MSAKHCVSCGMPMRAPEEHARSDVACSFCVQCATPLGELKPYDDVLRGFVGFLQSTQGIDDGAALEIARETLSKLPAWRDR